MYLLLCIIAAISTAIANPVPADEAHREKPLVFSLGKDNTPSAVYRESAYHDQTVPDTGSYGTISDKYRIPNGITSEYPVGDLHIPLQASKSLGPTTVNVLQEPSLHTPKEAPMHQESWYPWRKTDDGTQQDSKCGESKSVCCMKSLTWDTSVVKTCRHGNLLFSSRASFAGPLIFVCGQRSLEGYFNGNRLARIRNILTLAMNYGASSMTGIPLW